MLGIGKFSGSNAALVMAAVDRSVGIIEFEPNGTVLVANGTFCALLGYTLAEIKGRHHSMFVAPEYANTAEYREFWTALARGDFQIADSAIDSKN